MMDLETLSLKELRQLVKDAEAAIASHKDREKRKALAEVEAFARERGLNPSDLAELAGKRTKRVGGGTTAGAAKYANPHDSSQTWSGRGRRPAWAAAHLAQGGTLDQLAI